MKKYLYVLALVVLMFFSCKEQIESQFKVYDIVGKLYDTEIFATWPGIKFSTDSLLVVYANKAIGKNIKVYSRDNMKEIASYGTVGRGPGEFSWLELNSKRGNRFFGRNANMNELIVLEVIDSAGKSRLRRSRG